VRLIAQKFARDDAASRAVDSQIASVVFDVVDDIRVRLSLRDAVIAGKMRKLLVDM
jgi:hypothetical protein